METFSFVKNRERRGLDHGREEVVHQTNLVGLHGDCQITKEKARVFAPTFSTSLNLVSDLLGLTLWLRSPKPSFSKSTIGNFAFSAFFIWQM